MGFDCFGDCTSLYIEVRRVPNGLSISQDNDLRCFVAHTGEIREFTRDLARRLNYKYVHRRLQFFHFPVSSGADGTGVTVFKNNYWLLLRVCKQILERRPIVDFEKFLSHNWNSFTRKS